MDLGCGFVDEWRRSVLKTASDVRFFSPNSDTSLPCAKIYAVGARDVKLDASAYGAVIICEDERVEVSGWSLFADIRRARLLCVVEALTLLRNISAVDVFTDFADLTRVLRDSSFQGVENADLWDRLGRLTEMRDTRFHLAQDAQNSRNADARRAAEVAFGDLRLALKAWDDLRARGYDPDLALVDVGGEGWRSGIINQAR